MNDSKPLLVEAPLEAACRVFSQNRSWCNHSNLCSEFLGVMVPLKLRIIETSTKNQQIVHATSKSK